ncbi:hypothetical protein ACTOB_003416 [Actinoplanes oblitus]|uniref:NADP-dependent oxidoreductase domain-containing protein n=1 Tax=Actinoplanes oblitus TaxID=3040509 RepID=A0ABY8WPC5_9ACTN|nr:hypothetical protein [Actinoplanes oblitus]WIM99754.1 hypothetical protein ACTOB_003416 [Actinoplanes oblitus]
MVVRGGSRQRGSPSRGAQGVGEQGEPPGRAARVAAAGSAWTPAQTGLAWLLHRAPDVLLIPGTATLASLTANMAVANVPREVTAALG